MVIMRICSDLVSNIRKPCLLYITDDMIKHLLFLSIHYPFLLPFQAD